MARTDGLVRDLARALEMTGHGASILDFAAEGHAEAIGVLDSAFPFRRWGRVDWSLVDDAECVDAKGVRGEERQAVTLLRRWVSEEESIFVTWTDGRAPVLVATAAGVLRHLRRVLDIDSDVWVFAADGKGCLEVYHEGQVCFGFSQGRA